MRKISQITVEYGRTTQPQPYESANAKLSVTLVFDPDEELDGTYLQAADDTLTTIQSQVHDILGIGTAASKPKTKAVLKTNQPTEEKAEKPKVSDEDVKAAAEKAKKAKALAAKEAAQATAAAEVEEKPAEEPGVEKGDILKAITGARERLTANGSGDYKAAIDGVIKAYTSKDKPPFTYNDIPKDSWADFVRDLNDLGR